MKCVRIVGNGFVSDDRPGIEPGEEKTYRILLLDLGRSSGHLSQFHPRLHHQRKNSGEFPA